MSKRVERPGVRSGYDRWSELYDKTPNPLVALDRRHTIEVLSPHRGQRILDAGCGTGAHLTALAAAGSRPVGLDFSRGMLRVAQRNNPHVPLAQADLNRGFPVRRNGCDAVLCALVSEHLTNLRTFFLEALAVLKRGGRFVFSAFHPELAAAGIEANFEQNGVEYRLGAERYTVADYLNHMDDAGFEMLCCRHFRGDSALVEEVPGSSKYLDRPLLLIIEAIRPTRSAV
jgi:SAM-dependent methyltransferase